MRWPEEDRIATAAVRRPVECGDLRTTRLGLGPRPRPGDPRGDLGHRPGAGGGVPGPSAAVDPCWYCSRNECSGHRRRDQLTRRFVVTAEIQVSMALLQSQAQSRLQLHGGKAPPMVAGGLGGDAAPRGWRVLGRTLALLAGGPPRDFCHISPSARLRVDNQRQARVRVGSGRRHHLRTEREKGWRSEVSVIAIRTRSEFSQLIRRRDSHL